jgi:23S rRNA pseudouridine955/2504/2580 synthase
VRDREFSGSKEIITKYRVIDSKNDISLLEVDLITGRTHQIRAHMSHIGHSLVGDGKYGVNRDERARGYKYQALYAYKLYFKKTDRDDILSYLEDKSFMLDKNDIWFLKDFKE